MSDKQSETTVLWLVGGLFAVVAVMLGVDHFHKPAPREPVAQTAADATASVPNPNPNPGSAEPEPPTYNPRAVMEDPEFADVAPKLPPGARMPDRLQMSRDPGDQMRAALRALILSQEIYMADNGFMRYAGRIEELKEMPVIPGVTVTLRPAGTLGYVATALHAKAPNKRCALYVGTEPMPPATTQGQIGCD